jgi:putative nucleotidyltransferase with HDIG domain
MEVLDDPRSGANAVADVIALDASLTVRLLKMVNSAGFAHRRQIDSVKQAVGVVGMTRVRDLALATSVTTFFKDVPPELIHAADFWRHSLATAVGARVIAGVRNAPNPDRFFVAGLLHDIGRLVLYIGAPEHAMAILDRARQERTFLYEAERDLIGFDHGAIGGALMEHWNMPDALIQSIAHHHDPAGTTAFAVEATTVYLADVFAHELGLGRSGEQLVPARSEGALDLLGIQPDTTSVALERIEVQYGEALKLFGLSED